MALVKHKKESIIRETLSNKQDNISNNPDNLNFSFEDFCANQDYACSFSDWQRGGLLARALETLHGYCKSPVGYDGDKFCFYGDFPKQGYTRFKHPEHVSLDAKWVRMHITGTGILAGHIVGNTFYIVFLDKSHAFYLTKRNRKKIFGKENP